MTINDYDTERERDAFANGFIFGTPYIGQDVADVPCPLSGEWAGESMNELLGDDWDWNIAEAFESGYWAAVMGERTEVTS